MVYKNKEYMKQYYLENKRKILERIKQNRDDKKEYDKKYYIKNREMLLKKGSLFRKTEKGKATDQRNKIKRNTTLKNIINTLTAEEWIDILKKYKFKCAYCSKEFNLFDRPTRDHVIPISKGGNNIKENIVPACGSCNSKKHDKLLIKKEEKRCD